MFDRHQKKQTMLNNIDEMDKVDQFDVLNSLKWKLISPQLIQIFQSLSPQAPILFWIHYFNSIISD